MLQFFTFIFHNIGISILTLTILQRSVQLRCCWCPNWLNSSW